MTDSSAAGVGRAAGLGRDRPNWPAGMPRPLINAAEKEGGVEPVLDELGRDRKRRLEGLSALRRTAGVGPGLDRAQRPDPDRGLREEGLEPGLAVPAGPESPRAAGLACASSLARPGRSGIGATSASRFRSARPFRSMRTNCKHCVTGSAALTGATPILYVSTDPDLIGGLVVQVGDHRYDASVKSRLAQLRQRLIEGKMHEIQSRRDQFSHST